MQVSDVKVFGVIGAGQMGSGIAQVAAATGYKVLLVDVSKDLVDKAKGKIGSILQKQVDKGKLTAEARAALLDNIEPVEDFRAFDKVDIAIEAATENTETKLKLFHAVDEVLPSTPSWRRTRPRSRSPSSRRRLADRTRSSACTS